MPSGGFTKRSKVLQKMHGLGITQNGQQYLKLVSIFWRNCLEFFSFQMNGVYGCTPIKVSGNKYEPQPLFVNQLLTALSKELLNYELNYVKMGTYINIRLCISGRLVIEFPNAG